MRSNFKLYIHIYACVLVYICLYTDIYRERKNNGCVYNDGSVLECLPSMYEAMNFTRENKSGYY